MKFALKRQRAIMRMCVCVLYIITVLRNKVKFFTHTYFYKKKHRKDKPGKTFIIKPILCQRLPSTLRIKR